MTSEAEWSGTVDEADLAKAGLTAEQLNLGAEVLAAYLFRPSNYADGPSAEQVGVVLSNTLGLSPDSIEVGHLTDEEAELERMTSQTD